MAAAASWIARRRVVYVIVSSSASCGIEVSIRVLLGYRDAQRSLDTDPGFDDALALLYLHRHPDVEILGITTVAGNGTIERARSSGTCRRDGMRDPVIPRARIYGWLV
jgi:hypothetical protein